MFSIALALGLASLIPGPLTQDNPTAAVDLVAGLRASLAREERLGIAAEKKELEEDWVERAIRDAVKTDGHPSRASWQPSYLHLGRWNKAARTRAIAEGVHRVLVVQTLSIKKGDKKSTNYRPIGGGDSTRIKFQGVRVTMKLRVDTWSPVKGRWSDGERWSLEDDWTTPPAGVSASEVKNGLVTLDPADALIPILTSLIRKQSRRAMRASLTLPVDRPVGWISLLTQDEEHELWRRLAAVRFGLIPDLWHNDLPFPTREVAELALLRLETPDPGGEFKYVRGRAAHFLRPVLVGYRDGVRATLPRNIPARARARAPAPTPATDDAAGFRALFEAGLASLDSPEGVRFNRSKGRNRQSDGRRPFDLVIHKDVMSDGLISDIPFAGVARSYLVVIDDRIIERPNKDWRRPLRGLKGAAIIERKDGKLVRTAALSAREVTSERIAAMLLSRLRSD